MTDQKRRVTALEKVTSPDPEAIERLAACWIDLGMSRDEAFAAAIAPRMTHEQWLQTLL